MGTVFLPSLFPFSLIQSQLVVSRAGCALWWCCLGVQRWHFCSKARVPFSSDATDGSRGCWLSWSPQCSHCSVSPQRCLKSNSRYSAQAQALLKLRATSNFKQEQTICLLKKRRNSLLGISLNGLICWSGRNREPSFMFSLLSQVKWKPNLTAKCHLWEFRCVVSILKQPAGFLL